MLLSDPGFAAVVRFIDSDFAFSVRARVRNLLQCNMRNSGGRGLVQGKKGLVYTAHRSPYRHHSGCVLLVNVIKENSLNILCLCVLSASCVTLVTIGTDVA